MQPSWFVVWLPILLSVGCASVHVSPSLDSRYKIGQTLFVDDFSKDSGRWTSELEKGGFVEIHDGRLEIDVPAGCTVWFKPQITGPVLIEYDATIVKSGGANDRISDLNCFWMANDPRSPGNILTVPRSGKFADYNQLFCYYVGQGGNTNTTTRFRRYIGSPTTRPILPEHDLSAEPFLLKPNISQKIQLVADGSLIQYWRDGERIFEYNDPQPYAQGWFAFRTTFNHMIVKNFRVSRLVR